MYAIIEIQGHQYIVREGDTLIVDKITEVPVGQTTSTAPLAVFTEDASTVTIGEPFVSDATVEYEIINHTKGDKLHVYKFKRKNRYSRKI